MFTIVELIPWIPKDYYTKLSSFKDVNDQSLGVLYDDYKDSVSSNITEFTGYESADLAVGAEFEGAKSLLIPHYANLLKFYSRGLVGRVGEDIGKSYEYSMSQLKRISKPPSAVSTSDSGGLASSGLIDDLGGF